MKTDFLYRRRQAAVAETAGPVEEQGFWATDYRGQASMLQEGDDPKMIFDLEERTARFGEAVIGLAKRIPQTAVNTRLISQLVGSGTSVGANFCEAEDSVSRKDFKSKVGICRKESKETKYWLRMIAAAEPSLKAEARALWQEARELNLIFGAIWRKP
jgi:four helix bundle protein